MGVTILVSLRHQAEDEGLTPGTPAFEFRLLALRVEKCMELQHVSSCSACRAYFGCELTREHQRWSKFGPPKARD
jgi:hypothetical protein